MPSSRSSLLLCSPPLCLSKAENLKCNQFCILLSSFYISLQLYFTSLSFENSYNFVLNFGFFFTCIYALFYVSLDKKSKSLAALLCFFLLGRQQFSCTSTWVFSCLEGYNFRCCFGVCNSNLYVLCSLSI